MRHSKIFIFIFARSWKIEKQIERIFAKNFARNYEKTNTWNIRRLVDESFFQSTQQASVFYWRLPNLLSYQKILVHLIPISTKWQCGALNKKCSSELLTIQTWTEEKRCKGLVNGTHYHPIPFMHTCARKKGLVSSRNVLVPI